MARMLRGDPRPAADRATDRNDPRRRLPLSVLLLLIPSSVQATPAAGADADRQAAETALIAEGLADQGMPELVEELLPDPSPVARVMIARAYLRAARDDRDAARREADLDRAERAYRAALDSARGGSWSTDPKRRFSVARWRVELADLILRQRCASDLDERELTSGLAPPPPRLGERLEGAIAEYRAADATLTELSNRLERDDDEVLAAGIAEQVPALARSCSLNLAWALTHRSGTQPAGAPQRAAALADALRRFDDVAHGSRAEEEKLNALLGAGVAFRESNRPDDAWGILQRLAREKAPQTLLIRARHELGRTALARKDYDSAGRIFSALAATGSPTTAADRDATRFYIRLAPLLRAHAMLGKAAAGGPQAVDLRRRASAEFSRIAGRGGPWPALVDLYLAQGIPADADPQTLTPREGLLLGERLLAGGRIAEACRALESVLASLKVGESLEAERAAFLLAGCCERLGQSARAIEQYLGLVERGRDRELTLTAARAAIELTARRAAGSRLDRDAQALAEVCRRALKALPDAPETDDVAWTAATALHRCGRADEARHAYERISQQSPHFWQARVAALACKQTVAAATGPTSRAVLDSDRLDGGDRGSGTTPLATASVAQRAALADDWDRLAGSLEHAAETQPARGDELQPLRQTAWLSVAELWATVPVGRYADALDRLARLERGGPVAADLMERFIACRVRCLCGLRRYDALEAVLGRDLPRLSPAAAGALLLGLSGDLEHEVQQHLDAHQPDAARRTAAAALPILHRLRTWIEAQPDRADLVPVVRFSEARMLVEAQRGAEALPLLDALIQARPDSADYRRLRALALEAIARRETAPPEARQKATDAWGAFLTDRGLRDRSPALYWEARYYWLRWQLRAGQAEQVAKGIEAERVWYPDLGGPPWRDRLLELADEARRAAKP